MLLIDDLLLAPINGFKFILGQIQKLADQELNDDTVIKEQLLELQMRLELDEVSEDEFRVREAELFARLRAIKTRQLDLLHLVLRWQRGRRQNHCCISHSCPSPPVSQS